MHGKRDDQTITEEFHFRKFYKQFSENVACQIFKHGLHVFGFVVGYSVRTGEMALVDSEAAFASHCNAIDKSKELSIFASLQISRVS